MLAFLLLLPLGVVLGGLYWIAAGARGSAPSQRRHDRWALGLTALSVLLASLLAVRFAPPASGAIWAEVHSALWAFFTLLAALGLSWLLRPRL
ncbi:MAG: hypothetical protein MUE46_02000 [Xanthomonadales bacterium]|jgi:hypothetical protein|nr:hypothetical protein [Xanthomonadales bacterium]